MERDDSGTDVQEADGPQEKSAVSRGDNRWKVLCRNHKTRLFDYGTWGRGKQMGNVIPGGSSAVANVCVRGKGNMALIVTTRTRRAPFSFAASGYDTLSSYGDCGASEFPDS